jgi:hypothetical protein
MRDLSMGVGAGLLFHTLISSFTITHLWTRVSVAVADGFEAACAVRQVSIGTSLGSWTSRGWIWSHVSLSQYLSLITKLLTGQRAPEQ